MHNHISTPHRIGLILLAVFVGVSLGFTLGPATRILAQIRETRNVGLITITADDFTDLGGGLTQAIGNIQLGDYLKVTGSGANLIYDTNIVTGTGNLAYIAGNLQLFSGSFVADGATGLATLSDGAAYLLDQVAEFEVDNTLRIDQIDLPQALVTGQSGLHLTPPGVDASATVTFTLAPGAVFSATAAAFQLDTAGVTLSVPTGASISNGLLSAPQVSLVLPAGLGGASMNVDNLTITPSGLSLGQNGVAFSFPDMLFGNGSHLSLTGNQALFYYYPGDNEYRLDITSTLTIDLPENHKTRQLSVELQSEHGESQLSGSLDQLSLEMAGASLDMNALSLDNTGLGVASATLTLPKALGGSTSVVSNVRLGGSGLAIGAGQFLLPNIQLGDGDELSLHRGQATLAVKGGAYKMDVNADLILSLPENDQTIGANFSLSSGQISGSLERAALIGSWGRPGYE